MTVDLQMPREADHPLQQARYEKAVATHSDEIQAKNRKFGLTIAAWEGYANAMAAGPPADEA